MLHLAGTYGDGAITWLVGKATVASYIAPRLKEAAHAANRPEPRVCVGLPIVVTDDVYDGHKQAAALFQRYSEQANVRRLLTIEQVDDVADVAIIGNEEAVAQQLRALADAGVTDFLASIFPVGQDAWMSTARTWNLLKRLNGTL